MRVIKDCNAGNGSNTYWRNPERADRHFCIETDPGSSEPGHWRQPQYARDAAGRVRRFSTRDAAEKAMRKLQETQEAK